MSKTKRHISQSRSSNIRSLCLFVLTLAFATWQKWTAAEVAWSMWIASLVGGYVMMLFFGAAGLRGMATTKWSPNLIASIFGSILILCVGLFISGFLFVHFTGFHVAHALALSHLLPMSQIEIQAADDAIGYGFALAKFFWPFAILVIIHTGYKVKNDAPQMSMATPYLSVVKNHILIFIVAFLQAVQTPVFILYVLLFYYFFPVRDSWELLKAGAGKLRG